MDDAILHYQEEDGKLIEPKHFLPIIPMVLVNGCSGIGTGWSTNIPSFHPIDLIHYIRNNLGGETQSVPLVPWVRGFRGSVVSCEGGFKTQGIARRASDTVVEVSAKCSARKSLVLKIILYVHSSTVRFLSCLATSGPTSTRTSSTSFSKETTLL